MIHYMKLNARPFEAIKSGAKKIEARLYDEKRKKVDLGDIIEFSKLPELDETIRVEVTGLVRYRSFAEMFRDFPATDFGSSSSVEAMVQGMYNIYLPDEERKYGVLGIKLKVV